jgi:PilZ domain
MTEHTISGHVVNAEATWKTERRACVRFPKNEVMWCDPVRPSTKHELDTAWMGRVRDISSAGIGLSLKKRFETGTLLTVELSESPNLSRQFLVRAVHATPDKKGQWIIGCQFDRPLSPEEMQVFLPNKHAAP